MEHAFGREAPYRLGMEEELFLVEADSRGLAHEASELLPQIRPAAGNVVHDTYEALVETTSPIVDAAPAGARSLADLRDALREAGATLLGAGLHPAAEFADVVHVPAERYVAIAETMRGLLERTPTAAIHVHVGMPDPETAIAACNRVRAFLPVLQGLAAHSPYWHGLDSGFASARAQLFRGYPRAVIPRAYSGWEDYVASIDAWVAAGELPDYTYLWWDVRPHPKLGTLELRAMDAQSRLRSVAGLAALVHSLAVACARGEAAGALPPGEAILESSFRAGRDGLAATVWWDGALRPLPEAARAALAIARPVAAEHGADALLDEVERILRDGNGADRMRTAHAAGGMPAVLERLLEETAEVL
jgi:carboxylate-amine ligase